MSDGSKRFRIVNWNVDGAKFLRLRESERLSFQEQINREIAGLCRRWRPDVVTLQEVTRYRRSGAGPIDLIRPPRGYHYLMIPILDTERHSHPVRWRTYREAGFRDASPDKGDGSKSRGLGQPPSHTVDYIVCNYLDWEADLVEEFERVSKQALPPDTGLKASDHYPTFAEIPLPTMSAARVGKPAAWEAAS